MNTHVACLIGGAALGGMLAGTAGAAIGGPIGFFVSLCAQKEKAQMNDLEQMENRDRPDARTDEIERLYREREAAYLDRNLVVALLARFCSTNQWPTWTAPANDAEPGFSRVVLIETPEGQISYHYPDELEPLFAPFPVRGNPYDGHSTEEKRDRLRAVIHAFDDNLRRAQEQIMRERSKGSA